MTPVWRIGAWVRMVALGLVMVVPPVAGAQTTQVLETAALTSGREALPMADDPKLEARLVDISQELRCLVCQNESLASSHAELAEDLRREVRDLLRAGKSNQEVKDFLVARYGDFVLYRPEVKPLTWVLWFGPFVLLVIAAVFLGLYLRQRRVMATPTVLSDAARERAKQLLKG